MMDYDLQVQETNFLSPSCFGHVACHSNMKQNSKMDNRTIDLPEKALNVTRSSTFLKVTEGSSLLLSKGNSHKEHKVSLAWEYVQKRSEG